MNPTEKPDAAVLIVDDQENICRLVDVALRNRGVTCWVAHSGAAAIEVLREHVTEIGCALVDMNMPAMDGIATVRGLRAIKPSLWCLLCTGSGDIDDDAFLASGAIGVITKPFTLDQLERVLACLRGAR